METFKEFINGLFESTSERVKSVFLGTYSILFIVWNWQLFAFLLFSTKSIEDKLTTVNDDYMSWTVFVIPFLVTIIYVFGMPWVNLWVDTGLKKSNDELFERKKIKRKQKLEQKAEEAILENTIASNKAGTNEINKLRADVEEANKSRDKARELNNSIQSKYDELLKKNEEYISNQTSSKESYDKEIIRLEYNLEKVLSSYNEILKTGSINFNISKETKEIVNSMSIKQQNKFIELANLIRNGESIEKRIDLESLNFLLNKNLITFISSKVPKSKIFYLTPLGHKVFNYFKS